MIRRMMGSFTLDEITEDYEQLIHSDMINIEQLAKRPLPYSPLNSIHHTEEIHAIIPLFTSDTPYSCILYANSYQIIAMTAMQCINYWLASLPITYEKFCSLIEDKFAGQTYSNPVTNTNFALFPINSPKHYDTIWLNPMHISHIQNEPLGSTIRLQNGLILSCDKHERSLVKSIVRALNVHILVKNSVNLLYRRPKDDICPIKEADKLRMPKTAYARKHLDKITFMPSLDQVLSCFESILEYRIERNEASHVKLTT